MLVLSGCMKPTGEKIDPYYNVPAIIGFDYSFSVPIPVLITSFGTLLAPEISKADINEGEAFLLSFNVYPDTQLYPDYVTASDIWGPKVGKGYPASMVSTDAANDIPIFSINIYDEFEYDTDKTVLFISFGHNDNINEEITYEMTYSTYETDDIPVVYLKAKKTGNTESILCQGIYAFDMSYYFMRAQILEKKKFNIMFKTGDIDGEDEYIPWINNPYEPLFFKDK